MGPLRGKGPLSHQGPINIILNIDKKTESKTVTVTNVNDGKEKMGANFIDQRSLKLSPKSNMAANDLQ